MNHIGVVESFLRESHLPALEQRFLTLKTSKVSEMELAAADGILRRMPSHAAAQLLFGLCALTLNDSALALRAIAGLGHGEMFDTKRWLHSALVTRISNTLIVPRFVNIGGGPNFEHLGWQNFDAAWGPLNPSPIQFDGRTAFSQASESVELVYSSHCLEHLDDKTVSQLLAESSRILKRGGYLLLKLPDWETAVKAARDGNWGWIRLWSTRGFPATWPSRGLKETPYAFAAMIHCGYWTESYGGFNDHFQNVGQHERIKGYHGPPILSDEEYEVIFRAGSPREITRLLRESIRETEQIYFNHRNAWSNSDLISLLSPLKMRCIKSSPEDIIAFFGHVPTIKQMFAISSYFLFEKIF